MFAYVFWHRRSQTIPRETYEQNLLAFYGALGAIDCPGVKYAATARISSMPWSGEETGYEDWTVIDGPGVLVDLNTKAVEGSLEASHAHIAQPMEYGAGALYYHLWGGLEPRRANRAAWLTRPRGIQFRQPLEKIAGSAGAPVSVWRRFMVLGPGPEFIIFGSAPLNLEIPQDWQARGVDRAALPAP